MPPIDWDASSATAVVVLVDRSLVNEPAWIDYVQRLTNEAEARGFSNRVFPVLMERGVLEDMDGELGIQAFRWDNWPPDNAAREERLVRVLLHQFCRMLRYQLGSEAGHSSGLHRYLDTKVRLFLSYTRTRHDDHGQATARGIREWVHRNSDLDTFFDVADIPGGVSFRDVINDAIRDCAMVACYSDSYSSREWCRREVVAAKRHGVPMVVVDCIMDKDPRLFPYLGNVPVVRTSPEGDLQAERIVSAVLEEVFRDLLWKCRVAALQQHGGAVAFSSRTPELCLLATLSATVNQEQSIVYPGPPIGAEEEQLFADIDPRIRLRTLGEWIRRQHS